MSWVRYRECDRSRHSPGSSPTTSLRCCTPIRGKLIVTISLYLLYPPEPPPSRPHLYTSPTLAVGNPLSPISLRISCAPPLILIALPLSSRSVYLVSLLPESLVSLLLYRCCLSLRCLSVARYAFLFFYLLTNSLFLHSSKSVLLSRRASFLPPVSSTSLAFHFCFSPRSYCAQSLISPRCIFIFLLPWPLNSWSFLDQPVWKLLYLFIRFVSQGFYYFQGIHCISASLSPFNFYFSIVFIRKLLFSGVSTFLLFFSLPFYLTYPVLLLSFLFPRFHVFYPFCYVSASLPLPFSFSFFSILYRNAIDYYTVGPLRVYTTAGTDCNSSDNNLQ